MASHTSHTSHTRHTQPYGHGGAAIWYRVRADLRGRRVQTGSVVLIVALSTLLIGLGLIVFGSVQAPFDSLFTQLNGAHVWLTTSPQAQFTQAQLTAIRDAPNVIAPTDLEKAAQGYILLGPSKLRANLMSYPAQQPSIGQ